MFRLCFFLGVFIVLILSGCASTPSETIAMENDTMNKSESKVIGHTPPASKIESSLDLLKQTKTVSVITPGGFELELQDQSWMERVMQQWNRFIKSDSVVQNYTYTLLLRLDGSNPIVLRVGNESIAIADMTFTSELLPEIISDIRTTIGKQLLKDLTLERITVLMMDSAHPPLVLADDEVNALRETIASATLIQEQTDILYPLFPHYVIQVFNGDKSVIHLDVTGNNTISIPYGTDHAFYYYVSENVYNDFYQALPPFHFLDDHPKSLFIASAVEVDLPNGELYRFGNKAEPMPMRDSIADSIVRLLVDGYKEVPSPQPLVEEVVLTFTNGGQQKVVNVYADGYKYKDTYYQSYNIGEKIRKHIEMQKK